MRKNIKDILATRGFNLEDLQNLGITLTHFINEQVSMKEIVEYINHDIQERISYQRLHKIPGRKWLSNGVRCPDCNVLMGLYQVNNEPGNQVGSNFQSEWYCMVCGYENYSTKSISDWSIILSKEFE